jgi:hypothetical protein
MLRRTAVIRPLVVAATAAALALTAVPAWSQGFPAPLPGQAPAGASPFPPVNGGAPQASFGAPSAFPSQGAAPLAGAPSGPPAAAAGGSDCEKTFLPLKNETEKRGMAIKAASARKAPPDEACKLIGSYSAAESKMVRFVESNGQRCGIPSQFADQMRSAHKNTEQLQRKVCQVAEQVKQRGPAGPSLSEALGSSSALPEATPTKRGGSTFDTLSGNVLTR